MLNSRNIGIDEQDLHKETFVQGRLIMVGIGINKYKHWSKLNNAVRDIENISYLLQHQYGFETMTLLEDEKATRSNIEQLLYDLTDKNKVGEHDSLLIYYSGHGHLDANDSGYWVPVDAEKGVIASYLPNSRIRELIASIKCKHLLLISDACFSGAFFVRGDDTGVYRGAIEEYEMRASRWAFCSGRHDELVSDGKAGEHSPFASAILQELSLNKTNKLNIGKLADTVTYITRANYQQLPEANPIQNAGHKGGQFVFTPKTYIKQTSTLPDRIQVVRNTAPEPKTYLKWFWLGLLPVLFGVIYWMVWSGKNADEATHQEPLSVIDTLAPKQSVFVNNGDQRKAEPVTPGVQPKQPAKKETDKTSGKSIPVSGVDKPVDKGEIVPEGDTSESQIIYQTYKTDVLEVPGKQIWLLVNNSGPRIYATVEQGKYVFKIEKRLKNEQKTVYFGDQACTQGLTDLNKIIPPNCFK